MIVKENSTARICHFIWCISYYKYTIGVMLCWFAPYIHKGRGVKYTLILWLYRQVVMVELYWINWGTRLSIFVQTKILCHSYEFFHSKSSNRCFDHNVFSFKTHTKLDVCLLWLCNVLTSIRCQKVKLRKSIA